MSIKTLLKLSAIFSFLFYSSFSFPSQQNLSEQCQQLFTITEKILTDAKRQPGTHPKLNQIEDKFNQSKKQIMQMEPVTQTKICQEGLIKLKLQNKPEDPDEN